MVYRPVSQELPVVYYRKTDSKGLSCHSTLPPGVPGTLGCPVGFGGQKNNNHKQLFRDCPRNGWRLNLLMRRRKIPGRFWDNPRIIPRKLVYVFLVHWFFPGCPVGFPKSEIAKPRAWKPQTRSASASFGAGGGSLLEKRGGRVGSMKTRGFASPRDRSRERKSM